MYPAPPRTPTHDPRPRRAAIFAVVLVIVFATAALVTVLTVANNSHPDPTQSYLNCQQYQLTHPNTVCVAP